MDNSLLSGNVVENKPQKLSILIPAFNEENTIYQVLENVSLEPLPNALNKEIILINDASQDNTEQIIKKFIQNNPQENILYLKQKNNAGKGACIQLGISQATGDIILIQDADLEYSPRDYPALLSPILDGYADVVYGSRFVGSKPHRVLFFWHYLGNKFLTNLSNLFTSLNLTDMECGYKVFKSSLLKNIKLKERGFGFEPEVTAKVRRIKSVRVYEVGVAYYGRTYDEGKKINWKDGVRAIYCILRYNL